MEKYKDLSKSYEDQLFKKTIVIIVSFSGLILLALVAIILGTAEINIFQLGDMVGNFIFHRSSLTAEEQRLGKIVFLLRMPRVILGILAGIGLSISGTVMQSITRNPLVSPFTIGLSSAAAFGASIAIVLGIGFRPHTPIGVVINAFVLSLICAALVYGIANHIGMTPEALILTGVALSYLFSALTATLQFIADENQLSAAIQWTFGSLNGANWQQVYVIFIIMIITLPILLKNAWVLNAMATSGDEFITGLGINPGKTRKFIGILAVLITSSIISFTGVIGFVGLVSPHIARMTIGSDHRYLIPVSGIFGGILVLLADTIGRTILSPITIPVGIVISYIGVPLFINLILKKGKERF